MYRRKVTAATLRRHIRERRGEGSGGSYVPGVQVRRSDSASHGRSSVENNPKLGRQHDLLTKFQSAVCLTLRRTEAVKDILENHPFPVTAAEHPGQRWSLDRLDGTAGSVAIASAKGLRHPLHPDAENEPKSMITPLLVALQADEAAAPIPIAIVLSHRPQLDAPCAERNAPKLLYECWEAIGVEVLTYRRQSLPETVYQNHIWLSEAEAFDGEITSGAKVQAFISCTLLEDWRSDSAHSVLARIAARLGIPLSEGIALYKHCLWFNHLSTDLTRPLWRLLGSHNQPGTGHEPLPTWHPLATSRWLS